MTQTSTPDYSSLRQTRHWLGSLAPIVRSACWIGGGLMFAEKAVRLLSTGYGLGQRVELGVHALVWLGGAAVLGVVLHRVLSAAGELIELRIDALATQQQVLTLLRDDLLPLLEKLPEKIQVTASVGGGNPADLSNLPTADLLEQLQDAKRTGEADDVLDLRDSLIPRLPPHKRQQLDEELAGWFLRFFEKALRAGKAPLVAPTLGRAVDALAGVPGMEHLEQALPMVRQSAGLCVSCGKPYRGQLAACPACQQAQQETFEEEEEEIV